MYRGNKEAFTLIEIMVVILIIAVLSAVAWPQYKHAVLKSRFSTVMPIAKAVKEGQEVYYLSNNRYAQDKEDLDIALVEAENTQVELSSEDEEERYIYVAAKRTDIPEVRYIMYQKNSPKFAENIHCEAKADNEDGLWLCEKGLRGVEVTGSGSLRGGEYKTFLLEGNQGESTFITCPEGASCDGSGTITECPNGQTLKEGGCITCDIAHASSCSTTAYEATVCEDGYYQEEGACKQNKCDETTKPADYTGNCAEGEYGQKSYAYVCSAGKWTTQLKSSTCSTEPLGTYEDGGRCTAKNGSDCSGYAFDHANCFASNSVGCNGNHYTTGGSCYTSGSDSCNGGTFGGLYPSASGNGGNPSSCRTAASSENSCSNATFNEDGWCTAMASNNCNNNTFNSGSICFAQASNTCNGRYEKGSYCSGKYCPAGSPTTQSGGSCWDGNGNSGPEYCN